MSLAVLYRGPLSSCNYGCGYCPFAKKRESRAELMADARALSRFVHWVEARGPDDTAVFFTPWGEALIRRHYREAAARLTWLPRVTRVAAQTNLACDLGWVERCDKRKLALWTTYHPGEVSRDRFLGKAAELLDRGVRFSVGVVGLKEHFGEIEAVRAALPPSVYVWVNAYRREPGYYAEDQIAALEAVDPLFRLNTRSYASEGRSCRAGSTVIAVDGEGRARRCHFVDAEIGNLYQPGFEERLVERPCPAATCRCHIGYVHLEALGLYDVFGEGVLERIPDPRWGREELLVLGRRAGNLGW
jgi:MoaA/NifB/PqqE/SkfB family radical SAM enzyme